MTRRTAWLFHVTRRDDTTERCIFYAATKAEATRYAEAWAARLGVDVEPVEDEAAA